MDNPQPLGQVDPNVPSRHTQGKLQTSEKPLPVTPISTDQNESDTSARVKMGNPEDSTAPNKRPVSNVQQTFQRPYKRIALGNRFLKIALPLENEHGRKTNRENYLTAQDVQRRMQKWEEEGFDTRAFVLAPLSDLPSSFKTQGQTRPIHPDPEDERQEQSNRRYRVSIPDRRDWESYVHMLKEEKLRALGVSTGAEEERGAISPGVTSVHTAPSSHDSSRILSPSLAPSSAGPNHLHGNFQGHLNMNGLLTKPTVSHFPRFSVAAPFGDHIPSPQFPQSQSPISSPWSPHQHLSSQPSSRVSSPVVLGQGPIQNRSFSPAYAGTYQHNPNQAISQDPKDLLSIVRQNQLRLQAQNIHQQPQQQQDIALPRSQWPSEKPHQGDADLLGTRGPENLHIVTPVPRGHRQNLSESLQREVEEAEAMLEISRRENGHPSKGDEEPQDGAERASQDDHLPALKNLESQSVKSAPSFPHDDAERGYNEMQHQNPATHTPKTSISRLNVNAPEFKLEPKDPTEATNFSAISPEKPAQHSEYKQHAPMSSTNHVQKASRSSAKFSKLNVAAPVFTPQSIQSAPKPTIPSREFSFSSAGPLFNPDAPSFRPIVAATSLHQGSAPAPIGPNEQVKKIFGEVKFPEVVKPTKQSQALPIVKPIETTTPEDVEADVQEDESGRIVRADARQKRARHHEDDGDQVPLFATPDKSPWHGGSKSDERAAYFGHEPSSSYEKEHVETPEAATGLLGKIVDNMEPSEASSTTHGDDDLHETKASSDVLSSPENEKHRDADATFQATNADRRKPIVLNSPSINPSQTTREDSLSPDTEDVKPGKALEAESSGSRLRSSISNSSPRHLMAQHREGSEDESKQHVRQPSPLRQDILDGVRYVEPSYHDIDLVMKHMNEDLDLNVKHSSTARRQSSPYKSPLKSPAPHFEDSSAKRSNLAQPRARRGIVSPSPNRLTEPFQYLPQTDSESAGTVEREIVARNARFSPSYRPSKSDPHVQRLNSPGSTPPSDWNDALSSADEAKFHMRTSFFDQRVNDLVGHIVQQRLGPIEKSLLGIQNSLTSLSSRSASRRRRSSGTVEVEKSDADDEDDERASSRPKSPLRDRKLDQLKQSIADVATAQQKMAPASQVEELMGIMKQMQSSVQQAPREASDDGNVKTIIEEAIKRQMRGRSAPVTSSSQAAAAEKSALQIAGLESMLKVAETRAEEELKARRATEDALADNQRLLRAALQEAAEQRESAEATERSLQDYHAEQQHLLKRMATLEGSQDHLESMGSDLMQKNTALEGTLQEYRLSSDQWRSEIGDLKAENKLLKKHVTSLESEKEEVVQDRTLLRSKFDQLQESMHASAREVAADQSKWRGTEEAHKTKLDMLSARLEAEARTRERLELEIERLESQERDSMRACMQVEQTLEANSKLDSLADQLRSSCNEYLDRISVLERELRAEKEDRLVEVQRIRLETRAEDEAAHSHATITQNTLQSKISNLERQLQDASIDAETARTHHKVMLDDLTASKSAAIRELAEARDLSLQEQDIRHKEALEDLKARHQQMVDHNLEDRQRSETHFGHRLNLADERVAHHQMQIQHLEEKLEIAKQAASAAVQAAQARKVSADAVKPTPTPQSVDDKSLKPPEKISPQALRESILVLQEQLQAREAHIEDLETQISQYDTIAPAKLKDAEIEIGWLRELLGVRVDDLEDIIKMLSQSHYDRDAVKDAATRLKANLQMEQQEKERANAAQTSGLSGLGGISGLAASPRALPLAAAAAWGNWRKGREGSTSGHPGGLSLARPVQQTPPKTNTPQSLFAGLMTPPSTNLRASPQPLTASPSRTASRLQRNLRNSSSSVAPSDESTLKAAPKQITQPLGADKIPQGPLTPPLNLMNHSNYDLDAREGPGFGESAEDREEFDRAAYEIGPNDGEPFGPKIGTFAT